MRRMSVPAEFGPDFLNWLRAETERVWRDVNDWTLEDFQRAGLVGARWRRGTNWTGGLDDTTIDGIEQRHEFRFGPQHRLFLQTLHSTTPDRLGADYSGDGRNLGLVDSPGFYDWQRDEDELGEQMAGVLEWLTDEIIAQGVWRAGWGLQPTGEDARHARMTGLISAAPTLVPIFGHRYVVAGYDAVLSVYGLDTIVYGNDLRDYLLHELEDVLGEDRQTSGSVPEIPFWTDLFWGD